MLLSVKCVIYAEIDTINYTVATEQLGRFYADLTVWTSVSQIKILNFQTADILAS
jgi:hypothetical protein